MSESKFFQPLESFELFPVRLSELAAYLDGDVSEEDYPLWVRKNGAFIGRRIVRKEWRRMAEPNPSQFVRGIITGMCLSALKVGFSQVAEKMDLSKMRRVFKTSGFPEMATVQIPEEMNPEKVEQLFRAEMASRVMSEATEGSADAIPFFHGFALGLDGKRTTDEFLVEKNSEGKLLLHIFLWLHWPSFNAMSSMRKAYESCHSAFDSVGRVEVVGSLEAFRKFCNRLGISFADDLDAK